MVYNLLSDYYIKLLKIKSLCGFRIDLKDKASDAKTQLKTYIDLLFQELNSFFKDNSDIKTAHELLKIYQSPDAAIIISEIGDINHFNNPGQVLAFAGLEPSFKQSGTLNVYYNTKRAQGKLHYNALGHCAGKLVRTIFYMLKNNVTFNLDYFFKKLIYFNIFIDKKNFKP